MNPSSEHQGEDARRLCERRLNEIANSPAELVDLTDYAEHRLTRLFLNKALGEDIVQKAFLSILQGLESNDEGRTPRTEDLATPEAFKKYMHAVCWSLIEAIGRRHDARSVHVPLAEGGLGEASGGAVLASPSSTSDEAHLLDLQRMLFNKLRERAPKHLLPTIDAWEKVSDETDRIPTPGPRRYATKVREMAAEIVQEIDGID